MSTIYLLTNTSFDTTLPGQNHTEWCVLHSSSHSLGEIIMSKHCRRVSCVLTALLIGVGFGQAADPSPLFSYQSDQTSEAFVRSQVQLDNGLAPLDGGPELMLTDPEFDPECQFPTDPAFDPMCADTDPVWDPQCMTIPDFDPVCGVTDPFWDPTCETNPAWDFTCATDPFWDPGCTAPTDPYFDPACITDPAIDPNCAPPTDPNWHPVCTTDPYWDYMCLTIPEFDPLCAAPTDPSWFPDCEVVTATETPASFGLLKIAPNPFNPATTLSFTLPAASNVNLAVYDMKGQLVDTIHSGLAARGLNSISWDASRYASGIYLAVLQADGFVQTEKLVLMK
jgi:hypothetical protein